MSDSAADTDAKLVAEHAPLVRRLALQLYHELELRGWMDDLVAAGNQGLLEAHRRFDASRGAKLSTFAYYRIRGAMIDAVRRSGYASASGLRRVRQLELLDATCEGVADGPSGGARLSPPAAVEALDTALARVSAAFIVDLVGQGELDRPAPVDELLERAETLQQVRDRIEALPERERAVLVAHYFEGRRFDELAAEWGISKAWMSRLHWRALDLLRAGLEEAGIFEG